MVHVSNEHLNAHNFLKTFSSFSSQINIIPKLLIENSLTLVSGLFQQYPELFNAFQLFHKL